METVGGAYAEADGIILLSHATDGPANGTGVANNEGYPKKGGPLRYRYAYMDIWRPVLKRLGMRTVGMHTLRHSAAARMISGGAPPKAVQSIMGHRSAALTLTVYGHLFDEDLDALAKGMDQPRSLGT